MKDFANRKTPKRVKNKSRRTFSSKRPDANVISNSTIFYLILISFCLAFVSFFYFRTEISSIKPETAGNSVTIDFPSSLMNDSILIEEEKDQNSLSCKYFVQVGAYGNKKYAIEAKDILKIEIQNISINEVYSSLNPGKLLNSVISGPYENRSAANNAKEKITRKGFDPRMRTVCKKI
tara:strand:+ start:218 stop:751 length:534 start_codon:yes stop_codon:yes gene_type:complete